MNKIIKLNKSISSKIAAGEVIENPSAVIKELVENSIDAKADSITIEIKEAGKSYIRVTDNGDGIIEEDVILAFDRHATSKIKSIEDIYSIDTLGFRGEALASIAAVSRLELTTKTESAENGVQVSINGGEILNQEKVGSKVGTTIIVEDLFYNTPARIKFLNKNSVEQRRINELVNFLALSNANISFKYIVNDELRFVTPGKGELKNVILSIYGKNIAKNMIPINSVLDNVRITGYISNLSLTRGNSSLQVFFVNGRYIKSDLIKDAITTAYKTMIPINSFPICFLNITINSKEIDVNIHPSKTTIKFTKKGIIKQLIYTSIKSKLLEVNQTPRVSLEDELFKKTFSNHSDSKDQIIRKDKDIYAEKLKQLNKKEQFKKEKIDNNPFKSNNQKEHNKEINKKEPNFIDLDVFDVDFKQLEKIESLKDNEILKPEETIYDNLKIIGQLFNTYIISEKENSLYMIDQHAAHEKVLYEQLMDEFHSKTVHSQLLLSPMTINLTFDELEFIMTKEEAISKLGIKIEAFGRDTLLVREVPILFNKPLSNSVIEDIILNIKKEYNTPYDTNSELIIQKSCKNAIKAKDQLDVIEIESLIEQLKQLESPYTCPHGRPIIIKITKDEIEKKFKRK
jgi:DNA mismatch repair protein MutL